MKIEHRVGSFFKARSGMRAKVMRLLSAWGILFGSKFVILGAINFAFGDQVVFSGPFHGIVVFIIVIVVMFIAEISAVRFTKSLG
jgi:hypothetical protein